MKKILVALLVICMVSLVAVSAFAYEVFDGSKGDIVSSIDVDVESNKITVNVTENFLTSYAAGVGFRIVVFNADPGLKDSDGDAGFQIIYDASNGTDNTGGKLVAYNDSASATNNSVVSDKFEEGKTYYVSLIANHSDQNWYWTSTMYSFTFGATTDPGTDTADFSVIAYALAAITGCGALVVVKKK